VFNPVVEYGGETWKEDRQTDRQTERSGINKNISALTEGDNFA